jgi:hypothetical protein
VVERDLQWEILSFKYIGSMFQLQLKVRKAINISTIDNFYTLLPIEHA